MRSNDSELPFNFLMFQINENKNLVILKFNFFHNSISNKTYWKIER